MKCLRCQVDNRDGARFCRECAAALASVCPGCGIEVQAGSKFCGSCGAALAAAPSPSAAVSWFASPESYTPKHLAERILTSKSALEGERKQVTVLFADLKGSMELLANRDPEDARKILDPVLKQMMEAVHRYEGTVNQIMGDGIMALFGAPLAHEDHAVRACYAALRMQDSVKRFAEEARRAHGVNVQMRVGLNSGEVVVRAIGGDLHMDYTAVGQTTQLAARIEQMATPGTILISPITLALAEDYVVVESLGPRSVQGLHGGIEAYELVGAATVRSRFQAVATHALTRFVGRQTELEQLHQALDEARAGHGQVVAFVGEPGVGKSRLYWEFTQSHRAQGWLIVGSGSVSYGRASNYLPVVELLRAYFQIEPRDDARKIEEKAIGRVLSLDRDLAPILPALLWLLDVAVDDPVWQQLDPPQRRQQILEGVERLLLRESRRQPFIVVLEDLQWVDTETQALLDRLVASLPTARLLLLVNYRPEYAHSWSGSSAYRQLRVEPLPRASAEELLDALLGSDEGLPPLKQSLIERTEGNPFFLEESIRALVETKILAGQRGAYRLANASLAVDQVVLQIPATARALLGARIDRLSDADKRLLQAASVIGMEVSFPLLQAVAGEGELELRDALERLQVSEFLYETRLFPELEYTFKHALTHDVAYGSILQERRRTLHRHIVGAIETRYADRLTEHIERLAHHAFRGEVWEKAATYLRQAGAKALARSGNREAVTSLEQAVVALSHLPERRDTIEQAIDVRCDLRTALLLLGEYARIFEHLRDAATLAEALGDRRRVGIVSHHLAGYFVLTGDPDRAIEASRRTLEIATALGDSALQVVTNHRLGMSYQNLGDYRRAVDCLRRNVEALQGNLLRERYGLVAPISVLCRTRLVECLAELGQFAEGTEIGQEGARIVEALDHPSSLVLANRGVSFLRLRKGELAEAIPLLEWSLPLCRSLNLLQTLPLVASQLGYAYALSGRVVEAVPILEHAVERADGMGFLAEQSLRLSWLSEAYLIAGRLDEAGREAKRALHLSLDHKERGNQAWILRLIGCIAAHRDPADMKTAESHYRDALALAGELGMRPLVAHCHRGLGTLYRLMGRREQAREHLITATALYHEMEMRFWPEKVEAEQKNVRTILKPAP